MERIAVAGLTLHHADAAELARLARRMQAFEEPPEKALGDRLGASEVLCLSTCNRVEVFFARESGHPPGPADRAEICAALGLEAQDPLRSALFLHAGRAAARHLFRVACSLDSLVLGEDQILAQVREAQRVSRELGLSGSVLGPLVEEALRLGKRVREETDLSQHPVSVVSLATAELARRWPPGARPGPVIAVLGAGVTAAHAARSLAGVGLPVAFIANRSLDRARLLAAEVGARPLSLEAARTGSEPLDVVVGCTAAPGFVLQEPALLRLSRSAPAGRGLVCIDLALPPDLEPPQDPLAARIDRIDLEFLRAAADRNRQRRAAAAALAEDLLEERLVQLSGRRAAAELSTSFSGVLAGVRETFEFELERLTQGRLAHLSERDREAVLRWARATFARVSHVPLAALKRLGRSRAQPLSEWDGLE